MPLGSLEETLRSRIAAVGLIALLLGSCLHDDDDGAGIIVSLARLPGFTYEPVVPPSSVPPIGITWRVGFSENVSLAQMTALGAGLLQVSQEVWEITEGQVHVGRLEIFDNVQPGGSPDSLMDGSYDARSPGPGLDWVIYPPAVWTSSVVGGAALGVVVIQFGGELLGRANRVVAIPENAALDVLVHESGHLLFILSWAPGPLLVDEYSDMPDVKDTGDGCVMDLVFGPTQRLCSGGTLAAPNHVTQTSQPTSCWEQILADYPAFRYTGTSTTAVPLPTAQVVYQDLP